MFHYTYMFFRRLGYFSPRGSVRNLVRNTLASGLLIACACHDLFGMEEYLGRWVLGTHLRRRIYYFFIFIFIFFFFALRGSVRNRYGTWYGTSILEIGTEVRGKEPPPRRYGGTRYGTAPSRYAAQLWIQPSTTLDPLLNKMAGKYISI